MHIEHIEARDFRNIAALELDLSAKVVVVRGDNAQGKTNLLEALYVCATGRSFRASPARDMIRHGRNKSKIRARIVRQGVRHEVEVVLTGNRRTIRVDDRGLRRMARLLELLNVVAFFPDDLRIAKGSPEERRRFLDRAVANHRSEFYDASLAYLKALRSRNALLKNERFVDRQLLGAYDEQLVRHGAKIHDGRAATLAALQPLAASHFARVMEAASPLRFELDSGVPLGRGENFTEGFTRALHDSFARDRARGATSVGPHRGDLKMALGDSDVRAFASQGQQRAVVLSLKLAEVQSLRTRLNAPPILLLDDVSSELDALRTEALFEQVKALDGQVWISTTGSALLPLRDAQIFDVRAGRVSALPVSVPVSATRGK